MKRMIILCLMLAAFSAGIPNASAGDGINVTLINQNPDPARTGDVVEIRFMVENHGSREINSLQLNLLTEYPLVAITGEDYTKTISTLVPYQQGTDAVIIKFKARVDKDASDGTSKIRLRVAETDTAIVSAIVHSFDIDISSSEFAQIIYIDKAKLYPGEETELKFTITNVGSSPLSNLVFSWSEENSAILPVYSDDTKYIKYIDVGDSAELVYTVVADINADSGLYQLDLSLKFESESSGSQEMETKAGIFIGGETDFDVTFSESSGGQTSLSVANVGNTPALSVTVRIPEQDSFRVTGSSSTIIGNLDKGDYTIVSFQISQATAQAGTFNRSAMGTGTFNRSAMGTMPENSNLLVLIEYTDTTGVRNVVEKSVPIEFRSIVDTASGDTTAASARFSRANPWNTYITVAALIVLGASGYIGFRKRKALHAFLNKALKKKRG
jgi:hypothetical protein